jgi:hypothetical protein
VAASTIKYRLREALTFLRSRSEAESRAERRSV